MEEKLVNLPAERTVLSGIYQHGIQAYSDVSDIINEDVFSDFTNQVIYQCYKYLFEEQNIADIDFSTLMSAAKDIGSDWVFEKQSEQRHLQTIIRGKVHLENIRPLAVQLRKLSIARSLRDNLTSASYEINNLDGKEPISKIIKIAEDSILDIITSIYGNDNNPIQVGNYAQAYIQHIENNPNKPIGISSGFGYWDSTIGGGFRRRTVSLIGARMKVGKSICALNIGLHVAKNLNIPVLYLDTEMTIEDYTSRLIANLSFDEDNKVSINDIESGRYVKHQSYKQTVNTILSKIKSLPLDYINVSGKEIEEVLAIIRRWILQRVGTTNGITNDCLVIYDYVKVMSSDRIAKNLAEYQLLGFIMTAMHNFAVRHNIPILAFTQLNRDGITKETTDVIAGSDRILWLATNFSILKRKTEEEIADNPKYTRKLVTIFTRHGAGIEDGDYINIEFHNKYAKMIEGETRNSILYSTRQQDEAIQF